jgi:hypothetical protein
MERIRTGTVATEAQAPTPTLTDDAPSMTISEFCIAERLSQPSYHKMQRLGLGPATISIPGTRIIRITSAARRSWQERMAELSQQEAAKLEARRRQEQAAMAGKLGAASPLHFSKRNK